MTTHIWRGDAQPRAQVDRVTPTNVEIGDIFTLTINRKDYSFTATAATVDNVCRGLLALIGQYGSRTSTVTEIAEFNELSAALEFGNTATPTLATAILITGPTDGEPFTLSKSTTNAGAFTVTVSTTVDGVASQNEKQRVILAGAPTTPPTGGTFTLTFNGETTAAIAYNAAAATVQTALENLATPVPGDILVTLNATSDWTVEFKGAYAATNVALMTGNGSSLTGGGSVTVATTQNGAPGTNETMKLGELISNPTGYRMIWHAGSADQAYSTTIGPNPTASTMQSALEGIAAIGTGNVIVTKESGSVNVGYFAPQFEWRFTITFVGALAAQNITPNLSCTNSSNCMVYGVTDGSTTTTNEIQTITINNAPTGGTFTVSFNGATTAGQAYNVAAATLQTALEGLATIGAGNIAVTRAGSGTLASPYVYTCTFQGTLAATDVAQMTASGAALTGGAVNIATTQEAVTGNNELELVTLPGGVSGGTFTLTFNAETTAGIAYNASAATVQAALEALATPVPGDVLVTGAAGGPYTVEFKGAYAKTNVTQMTASGAGLTGGGTQDLTITHVTLPTGPNWLSEPENWNSNAAWLAGDTVIFENSSVDCLYGLIDYAAIQLVTLEIRASYTGKIGLPIWNANGYYEYRDRALQTRATTVNVGNGIGAGSTYVRLDLQAFQSTITVNETADPDNSSDTALHILNTHASSILRVFKGSVGIASEIQGQTSQIATLQVGLKDSEESDAIVIAGAGLTVATIQKSGGYLETRAGFTTATQEKGTWRANGSGNSTKVLVYGGDCYWNLVGTCTAMRTADGATVYCREDMNTKTITLLTMEAGSGFLDPYGVARPTETDLDRCSLLEVNLDLGSHISLVVAALAP